jgi:hypothetical protein
VVGVSLPPSTREKGQWEVMAVTMAQEELAANPMVFSDLGRAYFGENSSITLPPRPTDSKSPFESLESYFSPTTMR